MAAIEWSDKQGRELTEVEAAIRITLKRVKEQKVEAAVVAFALIRCARALLDNYNPESRQELTRVCCLFLQKADVTIEEERPLIVTPGGRIM